MKINTNINRDGLISLINKSNPKIAEIGVEYGGYTKTYYDDEYEIHLIDMWQTEGNDFYFSQKPGQVELGYNKILNTYSDKKNVKIVKMKSNEASLLYEDEYFDWIYLDADHSYDAVINDIKNWLPKVKKGGILSGHDFNPAMDHPFYEQFGVDKAVLEVFGNSFFLTNELNFQSWYIYK
jgi:hypothetical protein